jgi:hypothetical protein
VYYRFRFSDGLSATGTYCDLGRCSSSAKCKEFEIGFDEDGLNRLTNKIDGRFTITEIEVWEITGHIIDGEFLRFNKEEIKRVRDQKYKELEEPEKPR